MHKSLRLIAINEVWQGLLLKLITGIVDPSGCRIDAHKAAIITSVRQYSVLLGITKIPIGRIRKRFSPKIGKQKYSHYQPDKDID